MRILPFLMVLACATLLRGQTAVLINNQTKQLMPTTPRIVVGNGQVIEITGTGRITASASATLDLLGTTRGAVIYRGADGWVILPPGTAGQILGTDGPGTDPFWTNAGAGGGSVTSIPDGSTNGVVWTVADRTTIPTFTFSLTNITPTTVNGLTLASTSITAPGALSLLGGGSNQSITLTPSGTGVVNMPSKFGASTPGDATVSTWGNGSRYGFTQSDSAWFGGVMNYGSGFQYNPFRANTSDVNFGLGFEHGYKPSGTRRDTEHYFFWTSADGATTRRIYQGNVSWGGSGISLPAGYTTWDWHTDQMQILNDENASGDRPAARLLTLGGSDPRLALGKTGDTTFWEFQAGSNLLSLNEQNIATRLTVAAGGVVNLLGAGSTLTLGGTTEATGLGAGTLLVSGGTRIEKKLFVTGQANFTNDGNLPTARAVNIGGTDPRIAMQKTGDTSAWEVQVSGNNYLVNEQSVATRLSIAPNGVTSINGTGSSLTMQGTTDGSFGSGSLVLAGGAYVEKKLFVKGQANFTDDGNLPSGVRTVNIAGTNPRLAMQKTGDTTAWEISSGVSADTFLITEQSVANRLTIEPGGNTTITGNASVTANLAVTGTASAATGNFTTQVNITSTGNLPTARELNLGGANARMAMQKDGDTSGWEVSSGAVSNSFTVTEQSVANRLTIAPGGNTTVSGNLTVAGTLDVTTKIAPVSNDGAPLGDTTHNFSDLFLASGSLINIANGNWVFTHSSGIGTVSTGDLRVTTAGTNAASVVTVGGTQTLTDKTLTAAVLGSSTATTQTAGDNSTKVATTAYVDRRVEKLAVFSVDGSGSPITTGTISGTARLPNACTLTGYSITAAGATGTNTVKFWYKTTGTAIPTVSDIISTSGVSLSTGTAVASATISDFTTTSFAALSMIRCDVTAVDDAATSLTVTLYGTIQ